MRSFRPGSREHAEAIASHIASESVQEGAAPVARLYLAYFGRVPDFEGFDHYIGARGRGATLDDIADEFAGSPEFTTRYGEVGDGAFIDLVHRNAGLPVDPALRAHWLAELAAGRMTRGDVALAISEGAGFRALTADEVFVATAYAETLRRAPGAAELARWVAFLEAGNSRAELIAGLIAGRRGR